MIINIRLIIFIRMEDRKMNRWMQLCDGYRMWQDMAVKGNLHMKKKYTKNKKQYYDFDFSKYQYYYAYPKEHISFAHPSIQKQFITKFLQLTTNDFSLKYLDTPPSLHPASIGQQFTSIMKPLELEHFIRELRQQIRQMLVMLRIKKTLLTKDNYEENRHLIDIVECEIRSYLTKDIRLTEVTQIGQKYDQRIRQYKSHLSTRKFDEINFTNLIKNDFVVYARMILTKQRLNYNLQILKNKINLQISSHGYQVIKRANAIKLQTYLKKKAQQKPLLQYFKQTIINKVSKKELLHFQSAQNSKFLQNFLKQFDYIFQLHKNNRNTDYFNINIHYSQPPYIPCCYLQARNLVNKACQNYFKLQIIKDLWGGSIQHMCYKMNNLVSINFRLMTDSYNFASPIKQKQIMTAREMMKRQIQSIFNEDIDKLCNIQTLQTIVLVDEGSCRIDGWKPNIHSGKHILSQNLLTNNKYIDPEIKSLISLLSTNAQKTIRQHIHNYTLNMVISKYKKKLQYLKLYYLNMDNNPKMHVVKLINCKVQIAESYADPRNTLYLQSLVQQTLIDENVLQASYCMIFLKCWQLKLTILQILNGQICILYKIRDKLNLLKYKNDLPFEMNKQFLRRFTYTSVEDDDPYDFVEGEQLRQGEYPSENNDLLIIKQNVEVRRTNNKNVMIQGRRIVYNETLNKLKNNLLKIEQLCSYLIERRQNYLNEKSFTNIVDRLHLLHDVLHQQNLFQKAKINLMNQYFKIFQVALHPQGIIQTVQRIIDVNNLEYIYDPTLLTFYQSYRNQTSILNNKVRILQNLQKYQKLIQDKQAQNTKQKYFQRNFNHGAPQISSIYYQQQKIIRENIPQEQQQNLTSSNFGSDSQKNQLKFQEASQPSVSGNSQYHLKTSFQQILNRNSIQSIKIQNNLRSDILGRKKKKLISDSVLGGIFLGKNKYLYSITQVYKILTIIQDHQKQMDAQQRLSLNQFVLSLVQNFKIQQIQTQQIFSCQLFQASINQAHLYIDKLKMLATSPNFQQIQHYLCFNPKIIEQVLTSKSPNCTPIRGIYTCLNYTKIIFNNYLSLINSKMLNQINQKTQQILNMYSKQKLFKLPLKNYTYIIEQNQQVQKKIIEKILRSGQAYILSIDEYQLYYRSTIAYDRSVKSYLRQVLRLITEQVNVYEMVLQQLSIMDQAGVYFTGQLVLIENISNKVFIRKKIQQLKDRIQQVVNKQKIKLYVEILKSNMFIQYQIIQKKSYQDLIRNSNSHRKYIEQILDKAYFIDIFSKQMYSNYLNNVQIKKIQKYLKILPQCSNSVSIQYPSNDIINSLFNIQTQMKTNYNKVAKIIQHRKIGPSYIKQIQLKKIDIFKRWINEQILSRKFPEFNFFQKKSGNAKVYLQWIEIQTNKVVQCPYLQLKQLSTYLNNTKIRQWIQTQLLIFGCSLQAEELIKYKQIIYNQEFFPVFYQDNTQNLIKPFHLRKMQALQISNQIVLKYDQQYLSVVKLKKLYQQFAYQIQQAFHNVQNDTFLCMYTAISTYFQQNKIKKINFISKYGQCKKPKNRVQSLLKLIINRDPNNCQKQKQYNMTEIMENLWIKDKSTKNMIVKLNQKNIFNRNTINSLGKGKVQKKITVQLMRIKYKVCRLKHIMETFGMITDQKNWSGQFKKFCIKFVDDMNTSQKNQNKLNSSQLMLWQFAQKEGQRNKSGLVQIKQDIVLDIMKGQFFQRIIIDKYYQISTQILKSQLQLRIVLQANMNNNKLIQRQNLILKQTLNTVLAPKTKLNSFFSSPLLINNYFFAGSYKLGYLDTFLNKLKNRSVMVELAQGSVGFLLKVKELDQCVDHLCRSLIGFSQKQFMDRFRTFLQAYEQLKQKTFKKQQQIKNLKGVIKILKENQSKQIQALLYQNLKEYLQVITSKNKTYDTLMLILKGLENHYAKQYSKKYSQQIQSLKQQNNTLKQQFLNLKQKIKYTSKNAIQQSKDTLLYQLKYKTQNVLNKAIVLKEDQQYNIHQQINKLDSEILLNKLMKQKQFYQLRISVISQKYQKRIEQLEEKLTSQKRLQNNLLAEQAKVKQLHLLVTKLQQDSIQVNQIKREMNQKVQEETLNKFKLIKINQSLQGKIQRFQKNSIQNQYKETTILKPLSYHKEIQTEFKQVKRNSIKIRTQSNPAKFILSNQVQTWKDRWHATEIRYQDLSKKINKIIQAFKFNRNYQRLGESILYFNQQSQLTIDRLRIKT